MREFFTQRDFERASPPCSIEDMDKEFMEMLTIARWHSGVPYKINSAYRTYNHELQKGRDGTSSHTKGMAIDIRAEDSRTRFMIIDGLLKAGFVRIGIGKSFIHVDDDPDKDQEVIWEYYK